MMDKPLISMLIILIDSGYAKPELWRSWADRLINEVEEPAYWLIMLSCSNDRNDAVSVLREELSLKKYSEANVDYVSSILGYLYLRYLEGDLLLNDFLNLAWEETEDVPSMESSIHDDIFDFYKVSEKLDLSKESVEKTTFLKELNKFFCTKKSLAESQLKYLMSDDVLNNKNISCD